LLPLLARVELTDKLRSTSNALYTPICGREHRISDVYEQLAALDAFPHSLGRKRTWIEPLRLR
jgi:hypothetical protein